MRNNLIMIYVDYLRDKYYYNIKYVYTCDK